MEATEMKMKGPIDGGRSEEQVPAQQARAESPTFMEHRGVKRSRGSSAKERISKMPACVPGKRSSIYRGVTRHRWTGRYEAHLWDKNTWNEAQNKKGKQVYLGAYDDEEAAARAYDLAALKYWGPGTLINFPVTDYARDVEEMQAVSREDYLVSLRRKGSSSKQKAFTRHLSMRRWEDRLGSVLGNNKYLHLDADLDLHAPSNLDLSRFITWLRPEKPHPAPATTLVRDDDNNPASPTSSEEPEQKPQSQTWPGQASEPYQLPCLGVWHAKPKADPPASAPSALSLLMSSSIFKSMRERSNSSSGGLMMQHPGPSRFYEEPSGEIFSPDVQFEAAGAVPMYSQGTTCWDPYAMSAQPLSSC